MSDDRSDDLVLVRRCLSGDAGAYSGLVGRYQRPVFGLVVRMLRDPAVAEEITQEAFIRAYTKLSTFDQKRKFSSWLFRIAHNATIDELRKNRPQTVPLETGEQEDRVDLLQVLADHDSADPERRAVGSAMREDLEDVLRQLRPEYAEVMVLRFVEELAYDEISEIMDLPLGTVKTYIHRARRKVAAEIAARGWGRPDAGAEE